jgi:hypothetical protein
MQGKSIRSDIERAAATANASRQRSVPMPRQKPREEESYNPNWTDQQALQHARTLYERGRRAGETGEGETEVVDFIHKWGDTPYGSHMTRGYQEGKSRRPRTTPRPSMPGTRRPYDDIPR